MAIAKPDLGRGDDRGRVDHAETRRVRSSSIASCASCGSAMWKSLLRWLVSRWWWFDASVRKEGLEFGKGGTFRQLSTEVIYGL